MKNISSIVRFVFDFFVLFLFLFSMTPAFLHGVSTRMISAIIAIIVLILKRNKTKQVLKSLNKVNIKRFFFYLLICFFVLLITNVFNTSYHSNNLVFKFSYFLYIFAYVVVLPIFCLVEFEDALDLLKVYGAIFIVQFIAVLSAFLSTTARLVLYNAFYFGDDRFERSIVKGTRIMGIALHSATGSVTCSTAAILIAYLFIKRKINVSLFMILYGIVLLTTVFIGRTGAIVEVVILLYTMIVGKGNIIKNVFPFIVVGLLFVNIFSGVLNNSDSGNSEIIKSWITAPLDESSRNNTLGGINRHLPDFTPEFILGTGVMRGYTPGNAYVESDSGYVMMISSLGIVGAFFYYFAFLSLFTSRRLKTMKSSIKYFFVTIIVCAYAIEYKEPFMLKLIFPFMLVYLAFYECLIYKKAIRNSITLEVQKGNYIV